MEATVRNDEAPGGSADYDAIVFGGAPGEHCAGEIGAIQLSQDPAATQM